MASRTASIAEAVKASLNAAAADPATFGESFVAKRVYVPAHDLKDLKNLTVTVFAAGDEQSALTRAKDLHKVTVEIGIQKKLTPQCNPETEAANTEIDALTELAERVADHFGSGFVAAGAPWFNTTAPQPDVSKFHEQRLFTAVIVLLFLTDA